MVGRLTTFHETGMEGIIWAIEDGESGLPHAIGEGDRLRVFDENRKTVWEGTIKRQAGDSRRPTFCGPDGITYYARWLPEGVDHSEWSKMFFEELEAEIVEQG